MDRSPVPRSGESAGASALTPRQARTYFEFFRAGTHREVLLLGDLVEQPVHFVRSKGHKVLCASRVAVCDLCEISATDADVSTQQVEYYGAMFIRAVERARLSPARRGVLRCRRRGSLATNRRLSTRPAPRRRAPSPRDVVALQDPPRSIRCRVGSPRSCRRRLTCCRSFVRGSAGDRIRRGRSCSCRRSNARRRTSARSVDRKSLDLAAHDCEISEEERAKVRALLAERRHQWTIEDAAAAAAVDKPAEAAPPAAVKPAPPIAPSRGPRRRRSPAASTRSSPASARRRRRIPRSRPSAACGALRNKPAEELTAAEAVDSRRTVDYVLPYRPRSMGGNGNGNHKHRKGGA